MGKVNSITIHGVEWPHLAQLRQETNITGSWPKISTIGSRSVLSDSRVSQMGDYDGPTKSNAQGTVEGVVVGYAPVWLEIKPPDSGC